MSNSDTATTRWTIQNGVKHYRAQDAKMKELLAKRQRESITGY